MGTCGSDMVPEGPLITPIDHYRAAGISTKSAVFQNAGAGRTCPKLGLYVWNMGKSLMDGIWEQKESLKEKRTKSQRVPPQVLGSGTFLQHSIQLNILS